MRKKWKNSYKGYLLIESVFSLVVIGIVIAGVCTTYVYLKKQEKHYEEELAAYQFIYENALYQKTKQADQCLEKQSGNFILRGVNPEKEAQTEVKIMIGKKEYAITLLSKSFKEK